MAMMPPGFFIGGERVLSFVERVVICQIPVGTLSKTICSRKGI